MNTGPSSSSAQDVKPRRELDEKELESLIPKEVPSVDTLAPRMVNEIWKHMYKLAGVSNETKQQALRMAVYVYVTKNGASRVGEYSGTMVLNDGTNVPAAVIHQAAGKYGVRRFMRGNMDEGYQWLKKSQVMERDAKFIAKCSSLGVSPEAAFATADWLTDCPYFTPEETRAHNLAFTVGLTRARKARGDKSLEVVEQENIDKTLEAQGTPQHHVMSGNRF